MYFFQHYKQDEDGLCTRLTNNVIKHTNTDVNKDKASFEAGGWVIPESHLEVSHQSIYIMPNISVFFLPVNRMVVFLARAKPEQA